MTFRCWIACHLVGKSARGLVVGLRRMEEVRATAIVAGIVALEYLSPMMVRTGVGVAIGTNLVMSIPFAIAANIPLKNQANSTAKNSLTVHNSAQTIVSGYSSMQSIGLTRPSSLSIYATPTFSMPSDTIAST